MLLRPHLTLPNSKTDSKYLTRGDSLWKGQGEKGHCGPHGDEDVASPHGEDDVIKKLNSLHQTDGGKPMSSK